MSFRDFARIGIAHFMLHPKAVLDPDDHVSTFLPFVNRADIETFDCCIPFGDKQRSKCIDAIRNCGKDDLGYAAILFPLRKISLGSLSRQEQEMSKLVLADQIDMAIAWDIET
jgi:hypothetical protein